MATVSNNNAIANQSLKPNQLSLVDAANLIKTVGAHVTVMLRGQPGIGKSAVLHMLAKDFPDYEPVYIDCANLSEGDLALPSIDRERGVTTWNTNAHFRMHLGKPLLIMLDELTKPASDAVMNMLLPLILERRLLDRYLPAGSSVFATGNLESDGVGDALPAHAYNRLTVVDVANPTNEQWLQWAVENNVAAEIQKFAYDYPEVFARYDQYDNPGQAENPYIFNPMKGQVKAYCSPRSLARASVLVENRDALGVAFRPALVGTIGEAAAMQMDAIIAMGDSLPRVADITKNPAGTRIPEGAAIFMLAMMLATKLTAENANEFAEYVSRWDSFEGKVLFTRTIAGSKAKLPIMVKAKNMTFLKMASDFGVYL